MVWFSPDWQLKPRQADRCSCRLAHCRSLPEPPDTLHRPLPLHILHCCNPRRKMAREHRTLPTPSSQKRTPSPQSEPQDSEKPSTFPSQSLSIPSQISVPEPQLQPVSNASALISPSSHSTMAQTLSTHAATTTRRFTGRVTSSAVLGRTVQSDTIPPQYVSPSGIGIHSPSPVHTHERSPSQLPLSFLRRSPRPRHCRSPLLVYSRRPENPPSSQLRDPSQVPNSFSMAQEVSAASLIARVEHSQTSPSGRTHWKVSTLLHSDEIRSYIHRGMRLRCPHHSPHRKTPLPLRRGHTSLAERTFTLGISSQGRQILRNFGRMHRSSPPSPEKEHTSSPRDSRSRKIPCRHSLSGGNTEPTAIIRIITGTTKPLGLSARSRVLLSVPARSPTGIHDRFGKHGVLGLVSSPGSGTLYRIFRRHQSNLHSPQM